MIELGPVFVFVFVLKERDPYNSLCARRICINKKKKTMINIKVNETEFGMTAKLVKKIRWNPKWD